jgi:hypothetical protein
MIQGLASNTLYAILPRFGGLGGYSHLQVRLDGIAGGLREPRLSPGTAYVIRCKYT